MSEEVFDLVTGSSVKLLECNKRVFAYASVEPLQLKGKCNLSARIPQTQNSLEAEFYATQGKAVTLLGRDASELLGVLRVGIPVKNCDVTLPPMHLEQTERFPLGKDFLKSSRAWEN